MNYQQFLESKTPKIECAGIGPGRVHETLFDWQAEIVRWALRLPISLYWERI